MDNKKRTELKVTAIENGTVIDHLPAQSVFRVINILDLQHCDNPIYFGTNLDSKKYYKKGIIKVNNRTIEKEEADKIALVAPTATLIEIKDYQVVNKTEVEIPDHIQNFVKCANPKCITNNEEMTTRFSVIDKDDLKLHCHYCEKITKRETMEFNH